MCRFFLFFVLKRWCDIISRRIPLLSPPTASNLPVGRLSREVHCQWHGVTLWCIAHYQDDRKALSLVDESSRACCMALTDQYAWTDCVWNSMGNGVEFRHWKFMDRYIWGGTCKYFPSCLWGGGHSYTECRTATRIQQPHLFLIPALPPLNV